MQTDIPLKRLTELRAADFLPIWAFLTYLMEEKMAELHVQIQKEKIELRAELQTELQDKYLQQMQTTLQESVASRFSDVPLILGSSIRRITDPAQFQRLIIAVIQSAELNEFRRQLTQAVAAS